MDEVRKYFKPEFVNRVDDFVVFASLDKSQLIKILDLQLVGVSQRLSAQKLSCHITEKAKMWVLEKGYDPTYGARPLKRAIKRYIENELAKIILAGNAKVNATVQIDTQDDKLVFTLEQPSE